MSGQDITLFLELGVDLRERNLFILHGDLRFDEAQNSLNNR